MSIEFKKPHHNLVRLSCFYVLQLYGHQLGGGVNSLSSGFTAKPDAVIISSVSNFIISKSGG